MGLLTALCDVNEAGQGPGSLLATSDKGSPGTEPGGTGVVSPCTRSSTGEQRGITVKATELHETKPIRTPRPATLSAPEDHSFPS